MQISCAHGVYHLIGAAVIFSPSTYEFTYQLHVAFYVAIAAESLAATSDPRRIKNPNWLCSVGSYLLADSRTQFTTDDE
jgi:hypothetical protein